MIAGEVTPLAEIKTAQTDAIQPRDDIEQ